MDLLDLSGHVQTDLASPWQVIVLFSILIVRVSRTKHSVSIMVSACFTKSKCCQRSQRVTGQHIYQRHWTKGHKILSRRHRRPSCSGKSGKVTWLKVHKVKQVFNMSQTGFPTLFLSKTRQQTRFSTFFPLTTCWRPGRRTRFSTSFSSQMSETRHDKDYSLLIDIQRGFTETSGRRILMKGRIARRAVTEDWIIPSAVPLLTTEWSFLLHTLQQRLETSNAFHWVGQTTKTAPIGDLNPFWYTVPWVHASQPQTTSPLV